FTGMLNRTNDISVTVADFSSDLEQFISAIPIEIVDRQFSTWELVGLKPFLIARLIEGKNTLIFDCYHVFRDTVIIEVTDCCLKYINFFFEVFLLLLVALEQDAQVHIFSSVMPDLVTIFIKDPYTLDRAVRQITDPSLTKIHDPEIAKVPLIRR